MCTGRMDSEKGEPRVLPIYQSTTFKYDTSEQMAKLFDLEESGYFYTRLQNPTNDAVAAKIAALEGGVAAMLTSSGQAANFMQYSISVKQATICLLVNNLRRYVQPLRRDNEKLGIECTFVDADAPEEEIEKLSARTPNVCLAKQSQIRALMFWISKICTYRSQARSSFDC